MELEAGILLLLMTSTSVASTLYNSTVACFRGSEINQIYSATCSSNTTNDNSFIAVTKVFYGAQPDSHLCQDTDPASVCCVPEPDRDCFFANSPGELPRDVVRGCSGYKECHFQAKKKFTGSTCPLPSLFQMSSFTTYSFMQYQCVNVGLLTDVCHTGIIKQDKEVYINSNILHRNTHVADTSCSCTVSTTCGAAILFQSVDVRLSQSQGTCVEEVKLTDDVVEDVDRTITCNDKDLNEFKTIFQSQSNSATFNLTISGNHTGKLWLKVKSSWSNATVEVRCGGTQDLEPSKQDHKCPGPSTTTPPTTTQPSTTAAPTTTALPTTTTETSTSSEAFGGEPKCSENSIDKDCLPTQQEESLPPGVIGGIVAAGIIILLVIIFILVLVFRRHNNRRPDHDYDIPSNPDYETLRYHNPPPPTPLDVNAYDNPSYRCDHHPVEGATADIDKTAYDNDLNESVMVMPKAAVMQHEPDYEHVFDDPVMVLPNKM